MPIVRLVTGGQTGVDRAALDAAKRSGLSVGGWIPRGREASDGVVPPDYPELVEVTSDDELQIPEADVHAYYPHASPSDLPRLRSRLARSRRNVLDTDGTIMITRGPIVAGTKATETYADAAKKPVCKVTLPADTESVTRVCQWIGDRNIQVLNVGGPTEDEQEGIYREARSFMRDVIARARPDLPRF